MNDYYFPENTASLNIYREYIKGLVSANTSYIDPNNKIMRVYFKSPFSEHLVKYTKEVYKGEIELEIELVVDKKCYSWKGGTEEFHKLHTKYAEYLKSLEKLANLAIKKHEAEAAYELETELKR
jgi:hypothetical protein